MTLRTFILIFLATMFLFQSCIIVKHEAETDVAPTLVLSPKPEIEMSDLLVRSELGDMIAFLPEGWFFVDVEEGVSSDVFAVAVNRDYTLAAVFSKIRKDQKLDNTVEAEGLLGLARISMDRHSKRAGGGVKLAGKYNEIEMGKLIFAGYNLTSAAGGFITKAAVFRSTLDQYYEFALVPMNFTGRPIPSSPEIQSIFRSILTTLQY